MTDTNNTDGVSTIDAETTNSTENKWKYIPLTRGKKVKVSAEDYDYLSQFKWYWKPLTTNPSIGYAARNVYVQGQYYDKKQQRYKPAQRIQLMHRVIMNLHNVKTKCIYVDHINHDTLDNRRSNLRIVTPAGNSSNMNVKANTKSGIKGIYITPGNRWISTCCVCGEYVWIGTFDTKMKAIRARNKKRKELIEKYKHLLEIDFTHANKQSN